MSVKYSRSLTVSESFLYLNGTEIYDKSFIFYIRNYLQIFQTRRENGKVFERRNFGNKWNYECFDFLQKNIIYCSIPIQLDLFIKYFNPPSPI